MAGSLRDALGGEDLLRRGPTCARILCTLLAKVTSNAIAMCAQSCLGCLPYAIMPQESLEKRAILLSLRTMVKTALGLGRGVGLAAESAVMSLSRSYLNQLTEPEKAQLQHDIRPDWLSNERISHDFWHGAPIVRAPRNSGQPTSRWASSRAADEYIRANRMAIQDEVGKIYAAKGGASHSKGQDSNLECLHLVTLETCSHGREASLCRCLCCKAGPRRVSFGPFASKESLGQGRLAKEKGSG